MAGTTEVTYERVATACDAMWAKGINPTVELLRAELGKGGNTVITPLLKLWRQQHAAKFTANGTTPVTPEVVGAIQAWGNALLVREREINSEVIFEVQGNLAQSEKMAEQLAAELAATRASITELEQSRSQRDSQLIEAQNETQDLLKRLAKAEHERVEAAREFENARRQIAAAEQRAALAEQKAELAERWATKPLPRTNSRARAR